MSLVRLSVWALPATHAGTMSAVPPTQATFNDAALTKDMDTKSVAAGSATTKKTSGTSRSISGKLNAMADNFNTFYGDLEEETSLRKQAEETRVVRMERELQKIEQVLATETKRRIEAGKALQNMFEAKVQAMQKEFKAELRASYEPLQAQIDALVSRVELLEVTMEVRWGR